MKKIVVTLATLITAATLTVSTAQAQSPGFRVGLKAGADLSNLAGNLNNSSRFKNKIGFVGGIMLAVPVVGDGFFSIQPELLYTQKGFKNTDKVYTLLGNQYKFTGSTNYNYLDLPILAKINAGGFFVEAGPQLSYLLNINDKSARYVNDKQQAYTSSDNNLSNVNRFEVGYAAGIGFQATNGALLDIRYNGAFTDFAKSGYQGGDLNNARNQVFQATIGYLIGGK